MSTTTTTDPIALARYAIGSLLDGQSPNGAIPAQLGKFGEVYSEMYRAHQAGGTDAARRVFVMYAERNADIAALRAADPEPVRKIWSLRDLYATEFPPAKPIVPGLIFVGLNALGARPKIGKSWMSLQIAGAVGSGGVMFNQRVERGRVLILALEDSPRRIQERGKMRQQLPANADVDIAFEWMPLTEGGTADLITAIDQQGYRLIIIDTISRALGHSDQLDQAEMNVALGALQRIALDRNVAILMIDHHKKAFTGDPIDDFLGATSKGAVLDVAMGIYRERSKRTATLKITGRDIDDQELAVKFDQTTCAWQLEGSADGVRADSVQSDILMALDELGGIATITKIAKWLNKPAPNVAREINELMSKGRIVRGEKAGKEVPYRLVTKNDN
ncbi:MAG: AAA family ATPase [Caldilineaceae bacterium]